MARGEFARNADIATSELKFRLSDVFMARKVECASLRCNDEKLPAKTLTLVRKGGAR